MRIRHRLYAVCILCVGTNEFRLARRLCNEWDRRGIHNTCKCAGNSGPCTGIMCVYILYVSCLIRYIIIIHLCRKPLRTRFAAGG